MPMSFPGRASTGFTLIELLVTLAVISLLLGLAPVAMDRIVPRRQVDALAQRVAVQLRDARDLAVASGTPREAILEATGLRVNGKEVETPDTFRFAIESNERRITFFPDGSSSGGALLLDTPHGSRRLEIALATGTIRVSTP